MSTPTPEEVITNLEESELNEALDECETFREKGVLVNNARVRKLADEINHIPLDAGTRIQMIKSEVYRQAALKWRTKLLIKAAKQG